MIVFRRIRLFWWGIFENNQRFKLVSMHFENRYNQTMTIEKNILPDVTYQLSDIKIQENILELIVDYNLAIPSNPEELDEEYDTVIIENPDINEATIREIKKLKSEEIEIDFEIENNEKYIRIWSFSGLYKKIKCSNYSVKKLPLSKEQWINKYKDLINRFNESVYLNESQNRKIRTLKERSELIFHKDLENTQKKIDFLKTKPDKDLKSLEVKASLLRKFLDFIDEEI